jgi:hypothetical protein
VLVVASKLAFAIPGGVVGGLVGAGIAIASGYALAEAVGIQSRETQAYFQVFVAMPLGGLVGLVTGAAALAAIPAERRAALLIVALIGSLALAATAVLGVRWSTPKRPAEFRVRNNASEPIEQTYLGHDFRRATSLGTIGPGTTTDYHTVDLDERGSFNAVRGAYRGKQVQLTLELDRQNSLQAGRYTYVVVERDGKLELELEPDG